MVRWVGGSIPHGEPTELFFVPAKCSTTGVTKDVVCAIGKGSPCGGDGFPFSEWCFTICPTPYNRKKMS